MNLANVSTLKAAYRIRRAVVFLLALALAGCDPSVFRKPVADMKAANEALRAIYFDRLHAGSAAYAEREVSGRLLLLWTDGPTRRDPERLKEIATEIADAKAKSELKADYLRVREQAFDAMGGYLDVLAALASDEATDAVAAEADGLVKDMQSLLEAVRKLRGAADLVGSAESWNRTVGAIVPVFSEVFRLVSATARYQAIKDVSRHTQDSFTALTQLLGEEADRARELTLQKYGQHIEFLEAALARPGLADDAKSEIARRLADLEVQSDALKGTEPPGKLFSQAAALHSRLVSLEKGDLAAYAHQIKSLRQRLMRVRDAARTIPSGD